MSLLQSYRDKIFSEEALILQVADWQADTPIIFTNGCFDVLHKGHVSLLSACKDLGGKLIVGLNSDSSVGRLKGEGRPVNGEQDRALMLAALEMTDAVVLFEEDTPLRLIQNLSPDFLVKGGDYQADQIVGYDHVVNSGGQVHIVPFVEGYSTTEILRKSRG